MSDCDSGCPEHTCLSCCNDRRVQLEAEVKILTEKILRISAINWLDMGWIHGHQARDAIKKALKGCSDTPNVSCETPSVSEGG